jgi:hypothetical protein
MLGTLHELSSLSKLSGVFLLLRPELFLWVRFSYGIACYFLISKTCKNVQLLGSALVLTNACTKLQVTGYIQSAPTYKIDSGNLFRWFEANWIIGVPLTVYWFWNTIIASGPNWTLRIPHHTRAVLLFVPYALLQDMEGSVWSSAMDCSPFMLACPSSTPPDWFHAPAGRAADSAQ